MKNELKEFIECPNCETGQIIHAGDHYYCTTDNRICDFMIRSDQYGAKITKGRMVTLIKNRFLEPMYIGLQVFPNQAPVNGFIIITDENKVGFAYPNKLPVCVCPKCRKNQVIMKYSDKNDSYFYGCLDRNCGFTLPYAYRNKALRFSDIEKLCGGQKLTKEYKSKAGKNYTINVFLDDKLRVNTSF